MGLSTRHPKTKFSAQRRFTEGEGRGGGNKGEEKGGIFVLEGQRTASG